MPSTVFNPFAMRPVVVSCVLCVSSSTAFALGDGIYEGSTSSARSRGSIEALGLSTTVYFTAARPARIRDASLYSSSNDNDQYRFIARLTRRRAGSVIVLACDQRAFVSRGEWSDSRGQFAEFWIDRRCADAASRVSGAARLDRRSVGEGVTGRFSVPARSFAAGAAIEVALSIENGSSVLPVQRRVGGQQRGPRDNQFSFRVFRNGVLLPETPGPDFGGPTGFVALQPGGVVELRAPLDRWANLTVPGEYRVECSYETELAPDGAQPFAPTQRHLVWTRRFSGVVEFRIQPPAQR